MDLIEDSRFAFSCAVSTGLLNCSPSVVEKERFRLGERNEAGESEVCLSPDTAVAIDDCMGGNLLSSIRDPGKLRGLLD